MPAYSNTFTVQINAAPTTLLGTTANNLGFGDLTPFGTGPSWYTSESVTWQTNTVYHDNNRKLVHVVGKSHSDNDEHFTYNENTQAWSNNTLGTSPDGHMWNTAFSPEHGEYYYIIAGTQDIQRYIPGSGWTTTTMSGYGGGSGHAGIVWHPNLFGTGDGGVIVNAQTALVAWRRSTNSWTVLQSGLGDPGYNGGAGAYDSVRNKVWVGTGNGNPGPARARIISAGSGGTEGSVSNPGLSVPSLVFGGGESDSCHKVIPHPYVAGRLLYIPGNYNGACYISDDTGTTWSGAGYNNPFTNDRHQWSCGSIQAYGVVYAISSREGNWVRLWKPPS